VKLVKAVLMDVWLHWRALLMASATRFVLHQGRSNRTKPETCLLEKGKRGNWGP